MIWVYHCFQAYQVDELCEEDFCDFGKRKRGREWNTRVVGWDMKASVNLFCETEARFPRGPHDFTVTRDLLAICI